VAGADDVFAELVLVGSEDADTISALGDADVPLLGVGGGFDGRVGEQDVVHGLALGAVGGDGVAGLEFPEGRIESTAVGEGDTAIRFNGLHGDYSNVSIRISPPTCPTLNGSFSNRCCPNPRLRADPVPRFAVS